MDSEKFSGVCQDGAWPITSSSDVFLLQEIIPDTTQSAPALHSLYVLYMLWVFCLYLRYFLVSSVCVVCYILCVLCCLCVVYVICDVMCVSLSKDF